MDLVSGQRMRAKVECKGEGGFRMHVLTLFASRGELTSFDGQLHAQEPYTIYDIRYLIRTLAIWIS